VLAGAEVVPKSLVVIDEKGRRLLLVEGRQPGPLAALPLEFDGAPDGLGQAHPPFQLVDEAVVETHVVGAELLLVPSHAGAGGARGRLHAAGDKVCKLWTRPASIADAARLQPALGP
jgi:hypothetical protein